MTSARPTSRTSTVIDRILKPHREGLPAVVLHCGMHCYRSEGWPKKVTPWFELTGLPSTGHGAQAPIAVSFLDKDNPITKPLQDWTTVNEELYNNGVDNKPLDTAQPLARGKQTSTDKHGKKSEHEFVTVWTNTYSGKTRVFGTTLGHNNTTVADSRVFGPRGPRPPLVRRQARRGTLEAGDEGAAGQVAYSSQQKGPSFRGPVTSAGGCTNRQSRCATGWATCPSAA